MKNIHILQTDKPSRLFLNKLNNKILLEDIVNPSLKNVLPSGIYQHIYITDDSEIKEGDWFIHISYDSTSTQKAIEISNHILDNQGMISNKENNSKIILTTDQDLIKDGVQVIDDEFLEWFVENPSCEEVKIIYGLFNTMGRQVDPMNLDQNHSQCVWKYKTIIPKEEPKQIDENGKPLTYWGGLEKPKQERIYSEEDMISFACFYFQEEYNSTFQTYKTADEIFKEWFEQFKKK